MKIGKGLTFKKDNRTYTQALIFLLQRLREKNEAAKKAKEEAEAKKLSQFMEKAILGLATRYFFLKS